MLTPIARELTRNIFVGYTADPPDGQQTGITHLKRMLISVGHGCLEEAPDIHAKVGNGEKKDKNEENFVEFLFLRQKS